MRRPDQDRNDLFVRHLESIDKELESFCDKNGFQLGKNVYRTPCRVLQKKAIHCFFLTFTWKMIGIRWTIEKTYPTHLQYADIMIPIKLSQSSINWMSQ